MFVLCAFACVLEQDVAIIIPRSRKVVRLCEREKKRSASLRNNLGIIPLCVRGGMWAIIASGAGVREEQGRQVCSSEGAAWLLVSPGVDHRTNYLTHVSPRREPLGAISHAGRRGLFPKLLKDHLWAPS